MQLIKILTAIMSTVYGKCMKLMAIRNYIDYIAVNY